MCEVLGIARSSYYKALNKDELPRAKETRLLKEYIKKIYDESEGRYGSLKIHRQLIEIYNLKVSERRVQKLMIEMGWGYYIYSYIKGRMDLLNFCYGFA